MESNSQIDNVMLAETMAYAENPYRVLASQAGALGELSSRDRLSARADIAGFRAGREHVHNLLNNVNMHKPESEVMDFAEEAPSVITRASIQKTVFDLYGDQNEHLVGKCWYHLMGKTRSNELKSLRIKDDYTEGLGSVIPSQELFSAALEHPNGKKTQEVIEHLSKLVFLDIES